MDEYPYKPLSTDSHRHQIRLLTLLPGEGADELECTISHVSLLDQPIYEALSYQGDASIKAPIWCNYEGLMVTQHLLAAVYQYRYFDQPRTLWIDVNASTNQKLPRKKNKFSCANDIRGSTPRPYLARLHLRG